MLRVRYSLGWGVICEGLEGVMILLEGVMVIVEIVEGELVGGD